MNQYLIDWYTTKPSVKGPNYLFGSMPIKAKSVKEARSVGCKKLKRLMPFQRFKIAKVWTRVNKYGLV